MKDDDIKNFVIIKIFRILCEIFLIIQPIESINKYFTLEFLEFVRILSILKISETIIILFKLFVGRHPSITQLILIFLLGIMNVLYIIILVSAWRSPEILQIFSTASIFSDDLSIVIKIGLFMSIFSTTARLIRKVNYILFYQDHLEKYKTENFDKNQFS